jgi:hypothetical protein
MVMILKTFCIKPVLFRIFTFTLISKLIQFIFEKLEHRVKYAALDARGYNFVANMTDSGVTLAIYYMQNEQINSPKVYNFAVTNFYNLSVTLPHAYRNII